MKVRTWLNSPTWLPQEQGEINTRPSITIPDQSMTVREILDRHSRGIPITGQGVPQFLGDEYAPNAKMLDLTEIHAMRQEAKRLLDEYRKNEADKAAKEKEDADRARFRKEFEEEAKKADSGEPIKKGLGEWPDAPKSTNTP